MKLFQKSHHQGFTLVELLVVIVIVATLVAISVGTMIKFRKSADKTVGLGNLRQLQIANISYSSDHQGRFVPPQDEIDSVTYKWFENPDFISQIKGAQATYSASEAAPDTSLPLDMMDPQVVREKPPGYRILSRSYAYTRPLAEDPVIISQLIDPARSAAFITADSDGFVGNATKSNIAYRYDDKALVVYYGGHATMINEATIDQIEGDTHIFWKPVQ